MDHQPGTFGDERRRRAAATGRTETCRSGRAARATCEVGVVEEVAERLRSELLSEVDSSGHWTGCLSSSALSTATAVLALKLVSAANSARPASSSQSRDEAAWPNDGTEPLADREVSDGDALSALVTRGVRWLLSDQNPDGGWGDTPDSRSNVATTMLVHAALSAAGAGKAVRSVVDRAERYLRRAGGVEAVLQRYGEDRTFSVPILTHCALAGTVSWSEVQPLPFELACLPHRFFRVIQLPVVSYALPALIAVGQAGFVSRPPANWLLRAVRRLATEPTLRRLERIQPPNGGFLEATPLTSFVTMSLAACGRADHPVVRRGVEFLCCSVRPDGSWPIDTNLATWVTTLSINALGPALPAELRGPLRRWLLDQQYRRRHPYTDAAPGGWAWTDLPGGVPDADDTPGAVLALLTLSEDLPPGSSERSEVDEALQLAVDWLLDLQNRDGGWPTFCRGWGRLPFDRSSPDITAHVLRALLAWRGRAARASAAERPLGWRRRTEKRRERLEQALVRGFAFLQKAQRPDGSWVPLWFGNQHAPNEENPTYGTARVLAAYRAAGRLDDPAAKRGRRWLQRAQGPDGGWGGAAGVVASVEETALAVEALVWSSEQAPGVARGIQWLVDRVRAGTHRQTAPIGFYFAKLWYSEALYPLVFAVGALESARRVLNPERRSAERKG